MNTATPSPAAIAGCPRCAGAGTIEIPGTMDLGLPLGMRAERLREPCDVCVTGKRLDTADFDELWRLHWSFARAATSFVEHAGECDRQAAIWAARGQEGDEARAADWRAAALAARLRASVALGMSEKIGALAGARGKAAA